VGKKAVSEVSREVGVGGGEDGYEVIFLVLTDFSAGLNL
jgi:hypothetical protein